MVRPTLTEQFYFKYLISLTESGQHQLAHEVALEAADSNVFYHDQEKLLQLKLFAIGLFIM